MLEVLTAAAQFQALWRPAAHMMACLLRLCCCCLCGWLPARNTGMQCCPSRWSDWAEDGLENKETKQEMAAALSPAGYQEYLATQNDKEVGC